MITIVSRDTQATDRMVKRTLKLSNGHQPTMNLRVEESFSATVAKLNKWEKDMLAAVNAGAAA